MAKLGRPKNLPKPKDMLKDLIPISDIFNEDETKLYNSLVDVYLNDFDESDLTSSDLDDIMSLAMNRILELRLLKNSKDNAAAQLDSSAAIEKIKKQSEKIKENLSARRRDRINPNEFRGFSIIDLAIAFDDRKKLEQEELLQKMRIQEAELLEKNKKYFGNREDIDAKVIGGKIDDV